MKCPVCKKEFDEYTGRRAKKFCSDACKVKFWNAKKKVKKNNKAKNKAAIEAERETVSEVSKKAEYPLTEKEVTRHKLWKEGDPREGSNGFFLKYGAFKYDEITKK